MREESEEEMDSAGELSAPEDETDMMMELWINVCEEGFMMLSVLCESSYSKSAIIQSWLVSQDMAIW